MSTIDAWRAEGRTVLVHCHGGASRTGLILRAWLMRRHGWSSAQATEYLKSRWPCLDDWNESFTTFLREAGADVTRRLRQLVHSGRDGRCHMTFEP